MDKILTKSIYEHLQSLKNKEYSSLELTNAYLHSIEQNDPYLNAYITVAYDEAVRSAKAYDNGEAHGAIGGIPYALKDNICTKGVLTTCGSKMLSNFVSPYDAFAAEKLKKAGGILLGKTNMDEFAMGSTTELSAFKVTKNPLNKDRVPGGSSGGSAAAVVGKEAVFALGSETGGSIRQPAAFCGAVGMKPTYGRVSRRGLIAYASSLDQIGPITKNVRDNALIMSIISGHDSLDATSAKSNDVDFATDIGMGVKGLKIGIPEQYFNDGVSDDVKKAVLDAAYQYERLGAQLVKASIPSFKDAVSAYYIIASSEASSNLARYDGVRYGHRTKEYKTIEELYKNSRSEGFGLEVKKRIMMGTLVLSAGFYDAYYKKAASVKERVKADFKKAFEMCDVMIAPVAPSVAYKFGKVISDPMELYMSDAYTVPINLAGIPSLSIPCGYGEDNMPVGMQIIGPHFSEKLLYRVGYAFENREVES